MRAHSTGLCPGRSALVPALGATLEEASRSLPGDALVPYPKQINRATIQATYQKLAASDKANVSRAEQLISLVSGPLVALVGLRRRSLGGLVLTGAGAFLLYRGLTGFCPAYRAAGVNTRNPRSQDLLGTNGQEQAPVQPENTIDLTDKVDQQMWESFPASDPPSY